jgi:hypothetical protein
MKWTLVEPPRIFEVGREEKKIQIKDCARIALEPDELVTFVTPSGAKYDVAAKDWGFYATPSVNGRLKHEGFKTALVRNPQGRYYVMLVEREYMDKFYRYIEQEHSEVIEWLDEK